MKPRDAVKSPYLGHPPTRDQRAGQRSGAGPSPADRTRLIDPDSPPMVRFHLAVRDGDHLTIAWEAPPQLYEKTKKLPRQICELLSADEEIWTPDEWRRMIGLVNVPWVRRLLLMCRTRVKASRGETQAPKRPQFFALPDGQVMSTAFPLGLGKPWRDDNLVATNKEGRPGKGSPLTRLPVALVLLGLREARDRAREALASEASASGSSPQKETLTDSDFAEGLARWLEEQEAGAEPPPDSAVGLLTKWSAAVTGKDVENVRTDLRRNGLIDLFPSKDLSLQ